MKAKPLIYKWEKRVGETKKNQTNILVNSAALNVTHRCNLLPNIYKILIMCQAVVPVIGIY